MIHALLRVNLFDPGKVPEGVKPVVEAFDRICRSFGPFPLDLAIHIDDQMWYEVLVGVNKDVIEDSKTWVPFFNLRPKVIAPKDKEFICRIMQLDPARRPTATQLLEDPWFQV